MELVQHLKKAPLFQSLDDDVVRYFAENSHRKIHAKGTELFSMGDDAHSFFFVIDGWVKLYRITREGEEAIINVFAPGETFAEAAVFGPAKKYPVNAQIIEKSIILEIPRHLFVETVKKDSEFALNILGSISARQRYLIQQIEQVTVKTAPQRIGTFLLQLCPPGKNDPVEVSLPYDKSLIARRLNIQPETFSRAFAKLKPYGVTMDKRQVIINDTDMLAEFCDVEDQARPC